MHVSCFAVLHVPGLINIMIEWNNDIHSTWDWEIDRYNVLCFVAVSGAGSQAETGLPV